MTVIDAHILIEQGLHDISVFAYEDFEKEEIDMALMTVIYKSIRKVLTPQNRRIKPVPEKTGYSDTQLVLDDFSVLEIKDKELPVSSFSGGVFAALPTGAGEEYLHLINDRSLVKKNGCETEKVFPNRLTDSETLHTILNTSISVTVPERPVSNLSKNSIFVYTDGFSVSKIIIDYFKKPTVINFNAPPNGAGVLEFRESTCYKIVEETITYLKGLSSKDQIDHEFRRSLKLESD